jgi:GTP-binding protein Era
MPNPAPPDQDFEDMLAKALGRTSSDNIDRAIEAYDLAEEAVPPGHHSGYVAVVGQPNVGKSTLMNQLLGEKIAIVSPKPQTTRISQLGIYSREDMQIVFIDTPGIHKPHDELGSFMVEVAKSALEDADVVLFLVDASQRPNQSDKQIMDYLKRLSAPEKIIHVMNKIDLAKNPAKFQAVFEEYRQLLPEVEYLTTSALDGFQVAELLQKIIQRLPEGPRYFPKDQVSDVPIRAITAEMIREQVLRRTEQEVPHSIAVEVESFKRRPNGTLYIAAIIYTEREGQKGIIIGKHGAMLKQISSAARQEIEQFTESKVYLEVFVKILPNWRNDPAALQRFGYRL